MGNVGQKTRMDKVKTTIARGCVVLLVLGLALPVLGQDDMIKRRDEKLNESWVKKADWITDFDKARATAKASGKPIFAYFTRSYSVCPYCYRLEASVFGEDVVRDGWEKRLYHFIMVYAESEKNAKLFEEALETWKKQYGSNPRQQNSIKSQEAKLAKLKGEGG